MKRMHSSQKGLEWEGIDKTLLYSASVTMELSHISLVFRAIRVERDGRNEYRDMLPTAELSTVAVARSAAPPYHDR